MQPIIVIAAGLLVILAALPLVLAPHTRRVGSWLDGQLVSVNESTVIAVRAAMQRIGFLSGATVVIAALVLIIGDFDPHLAMVGYAIAIVVGAVAPLGGSARRHAGLITEDQDRRPHSFLFRAVVGLSALTGVLSVTLMIMLKSQTPDVRGVTLDSAFLFVDVNSRQLTAVAVVSLILSALSLAALVIVARRQSVAGATSEADRMVRAFCAHRIAYGALGGQTILLATIMPALQIFTLGVPGAEKTYSDTVSGLLITALSASGLVIMAAGIVSCALAVLLPIWIRTRKHHSTAGNSDTGRSFDPDITSRQGD